MRKNGKAKKTKGPPVKAKGGVPEVLLRRAEVEGWSPPQVREELLRIVSRYYIPGDFAGTAKALEQAGYSPAPSPARIALWVFSGELRPYFRETMEAALYGEIPAIAGPMEILRFFTVVMRDKRKPITIRLKAANTLADIYGVARHLSESGQEEEGLAAFLRRVQEAAEAGGREGVRQGFGAKLREGARDVQDDSDASDLPDIDPSVWEDR